MPNPNHYHHSSSSSWTAPGDRSSGFSALSSEAMASSRTSQDSGPSSHHDLPNRSIPQALGAVGYPGSSIPPDNEEAPEGEGPRLHSPVNDLNDEEFHRRLLNVTGGRNRPTQGLMEALMRRMHVPEAQATLTAYHEEAHRVALLVPKHLDRLAVFRARILEIVAEGSSCGINEVQWIRHMLRWRRYKRRAGNMLSLLDELARRMQRTATWLMRCQYLVSMFRLRRISAYMFDEGMRQYLREQESASAQHDRDMLLAWREYHRLCALPDEPLAMPNSGGAVMLACAPDLIDSMSRSLLACDCALATRIRRARNSSWLMRSGLGPIMDVHLRDMHRRHHENADVYEQHEYEEWGTEDGDGDGDYSPPPAASAPPPSPLDTPDGQPASAGDGQSGSLAIQSGDATWDEIIEACRALHERMQQWEDRGVLVAGGARDIVSSVHIYAQGRARYAIDVPELTAALGRFSTEPWRLRTMVVRE